MLSTNLMALIQASRARVGKPTQRHRNAARLYLAAAERHIARGEDDRLVAALVRAAWRAHERADADAEIAPVSPTPHKPRRAS